MIKVWKVFSSVLKSLRLFWLFRRRVASSSFSFFSPLQSPCLVCDILLVILRCHRKITFYSFWDLSTAVKAQKVRKRYHHLSASLTLIMDDKYSHQAVEDLTNAVSMASIASESTHTDEFMDDSMIYPELLDPTVLLPLDGHMSHSSLMGSLTPSELVKANPLNESLSSMMGPMWGSTHSEEMQHQQAKKKLDHQFIDDLLNLSSPTSPRRSHPVEIIDPMLGAHSNKCNSPIVTDSFIKDSLPPHSWVDGQCVSTTGKARSSILQRAKHHSVDETTSKRTHSPGTGHHLIHDFVHYFRRFGHHKDSSPSASETTLLSTSVSPPNKTRTRHSQPSSSAAVPGEFRHRAHSTGSASMTRPTRLSKGAPPPVDISCHAVYKIYDRIVKEGKKKDSLHRWFSTPFGIEHLCSICLPLDGFYV